MFRKSLAWLMALCLLLCCAPALADGYTAGTYEAEAKGNNGPVKVSVTFSADAITDVQVVEHGETAGLSDPAIEKIPAAIVENQSLAVDTVSGATNTSNAILTAVAECVTLAGGDAEALKSAKVEAAPVEDIDATYDVVIVGGGGAGLTASITAAQNGAKVILIEKAGVLGGNTLIAGQGFNAADPGRQGAMEMDSALVEELKTYLDLNPADFGDFGETLTTVQGQIKEYLESGSTKLFDTPEMHMLHTYMGGTRTGLDGTVISPDVELVDVFAHSALNALEWAESIGVEWGDTTSTILGAMWPRSHSLVNGNIVPILEKAARDNGVEIMMDTRAHTLLTDESGKVNGVVASTSAGATVTLHATSGVVLATGGFAANAPMVVKYNNYWEGLSDTMASTNSANLTGDGIVMAQAIGADTVGMGFAQLMPSSHPVDGSLFTGVWASAETQLFVNKEGKRFVNEYAERDVLSKAALEQTDGLFFIIADKDVADLYTERMPQLEETGCIYVADTLEELAQKMGVPVDTFVETVSKYNEYTVNKNDPDFGKPLFGLPIDEAPFVATPRSPSLHHTMGGLKVDASTHVLNTDGSIIPGLYAAGEVTGGLHAGNRLGGNAMTDFLVFGRIAGENAATAK